MKSKIAKCWLMLVAAIGAVTAYAAEPEHWVTSWAASVHGPYPVGNPSAQPNLSLVFPAPEAGARDQSFRLIVKPEHWGGQARLRFSNALGTRPVTFDGIFAGLQWSSSALVPGSNRPVTFRGQKSVTLAPGESAWSDAVVLPFVRKDADLRGRKLAVSFHIGEASGPMTWHAKALQSSYVTLPGAGAKGHDETEAAFPFATASWYFLDALDMKRRPARARSSRSAIRSPTALPPRSTATIAGRTSSRGGSPRARATRSSS